jgi:hypothetical protein
MTKATPAAITPKLAPTQMKATFIVVWITLLMNAILGRPIATRKVCIGTTTAIRGSDESRIVTSRARCGHLSLNTSSAR